ncbi:hypothetical protein [Devosia soli]|nr:hypothetical protein [Devosia soli]
MAVLDLMVGEDLRALAQGTWYIAMTNLPLWRKRSGAITYAPLPGGALSDVVTWQSGQREGTVVGIDQPIDDKRWQWEWRGVEPTTFFVKSRWRFIAGDLRHGWAVTEFEKTLFTPAGIDVYCRRPQPSHAQLREALSAVPKDLAQELFVPPTWGQNTLR